MSNNSYFIKFKVLEVSYHNKSGFSVLKVKLKDYDYDYLPTTDIKVVGNFLSVYVDDEFEGNCEWIKNAKFGFQLRPIENEVLKKSNTASINGLTSFLKKFIKGVGEKTIEKIINEYGEDTLDMIAKGSENLSSIKGIGEKTATKIHEEYMKNYVFQEISLFFAEYNLSNKDILRIYEEYGLNTLNTIKENPYILTSLLDIHFSYSESIAFNFNLGYLFKQRIFSVILEVLKSNANNSGHLFLPKEVLFTQINLFLKKFSKYSFQKLTDSVISDYIQELVNLKQITIVLNNKNELCYFLSKYNYIEKEIVDYLYKLNLDYKEPIGTREQIEKSILEYEKVIGFKMAKRQKDAVFMALQNGLSILTGGPGTGKTQTINAIIQIMKMIKKDSTITLCAPTGRASKRMTELTGLDAATIHRELGLLPDGSFIDDDVMIESDILIVDESSMIDAFVFWKTLTKIDENTRILFVGDHEQLPSVGPGLILRDLIESDCVPVTTLDEIFRQAKESQIVMNAHAIIKGEINSLSFDNSKGDFYFIERQDIMNVQQSILSVVNRLVDVKGYKTTDIQILTPQRKGELGVYDLNNEFQKTFNPYNDSKIEHKLSSTETFRVGDKVIQTVNNYELVHVGEDTSGVFNGDIGVISNIYYLKNQKHIDISFPEKEVTYKEDEITELMLAYSITIHKSQGSEFPIVIIPVHESQDYMLTRNLIYTGITRAKEIVVLIGTKKALENSINNNISINRNSLIKERLINKFREDQGKKKSA